MRMLGFSGLVLAVLAGTARPAAHRIVDDSDPQVDAARGKLKGRSRRRRAFAPSLALLAACGGSSSAPPLPDAAQLVDAGCPMQCSPLIQNGCNAAMKCNWLVEPMAVNMGEIACTFAGAVQTDLPCTRDPSGGDPCAKGLTCYDGKCRTICSLGGGSPMCGTGHTCSGVGYFIPCGQTAPIAGVCL